MNRLKGKIVHFDFGDGWTLVDADVGGDKFTSLIHDLAGLHTKLALGNEGYLLFHETDVALCRDFNPRISIRNRLRGRVLSVSIGKTVATVSMDYQGTTIIAVITARSALQLHLTPGDGVEALVKTTSMWWIPV